MGKRKQQAGRIWVQGPYRSRASASLMGITTNYFIIQHITGNSSVQQRELEKVFRWLTVWEMVIHHHCTEKRKNGSLGINEKRYFVFLRPWMLCSSTPTTNYITQTEIWLVKMSNWGNTFNFGYTWEGVCFYYEIILSFQSLSLYYEIVLSQHKKRGGKYT